MLKKVLIVGGLLVLGYTGLHFGNQVRLLKNTCFTFNGYKIIAIRKDRLTLEIKLRVRNKSTLPIIIRGYDFKVLMNNVHISTVSSDLVQTLAPNDFSEFTIMVDIDPSAVINADFLTGILLHFNEAMLTIKGNISVKAGKIGFSHLPLEIESKLKEMMPTGDPNNQPCL